jgi:hypothetical protein
MVTDSFGMRNFMQRMGWLTMHPDGPSFFPFVGGVEGVFFSFVPNMFPSSSQVFPEGIPNSTSILSHMVLLEVQLSCI